MNFFLHKVFFYQISDEIEHMINLMTHWNREKITFEQYLSAINIHSLNSTPIVTV